MYCNTNTITLSGSNGYSHCIELQVPKDSAGTPWISKWEWNGRNLGKSAWHIHAGTGGCVGERRTIRITFEGSEFMKNYFANPGSPDHHLYIGTPDGTCRTTVKFA